VSLFGRPDDLRTGTRPRRAILDESPELLAADAEADAYLAAKYEELGIVPGP
jgi:hypothetical protein